MIRFEAEERPAIVGLNASGVVGLLEAKRLKARFGDLSRVGDVGAAEWEAAWAGSRALIKSVIGEDVLAAGHRDIAVAEREGLQIAVAGESAYPAALLDLANPPLVVFARGAFPRLGERRVAIVGSRLPTRYGLRFARAVAEELAAVGVVVVSGLARGVDAAAHEGALAGPAPTYGVLGCGLARIYPPENDALGRRIAEAGGLISEFSPHAPPLPHHFPRRNRLIAALANAVLVVEARQRSGALITVRWAGDLGREVFAAPGQVDNPSAAGCLSLLRDGVRMVRSATDLLNDLDWPLAAGQRLEAHDGPGEPEPLSPPEARLVALLDHEPLSIDVLLTSSGRPVSEVLSMLLSLEARGIVAQEPGLMFRRVAGRMVPGDDDRAAEAGDA